MTALITIIIILAVLFLFMTVPINFFIDYDGENTKIWLRYLFVKFRILPPKEKKSDNKKKKYDKKPKEEKKEKEPQESRISKFFKAQGISGAVEILSEILNIVKEFLSYVLKHIIVKKLKINIIAGGEDAYNTAMNFGYACSGIYPVLGVLSQLITLKKIPDVNISADFDLKKSKISMFLRISVRPLFIFISAIVYGIKAIALYMKKQFNLNGQEVPRL